MSVSMRSTKAQMYSEIERLRDLLDRREQQARADYEDLARALDKAERERDELRAKRQAPNVSERSSKLAALKAFATKFKCSARLRDGVIELYSRKRKCWVAVPEGAQP